jgi:hypothetical protein
MVFLAGVDKALSLACELLYLANKVKWKWLTADIPEAELQPGVIETRRGLMRKLNMLQSLGLDLTGMQWIVDLRNMYIHSCSIYAGYRIGSAFSDRPQLILKALGPSVSSDRPPFITREQVLQGHAQLLYRELRTPPV